MTAAAAQVPASSLRRMLVPLAEVESVLFETASGQRAKALRSYLRSAPRLVVLMWAGELSRRVRRPR